MANEKRNQGQGQGQGNREAQGNPGNEGGGGQRQGQGNQGQGQAQPKPGGHKGGDAPTDEGRDLTGGAERPSPGQGDAGKDRGR
jgi:hypothetical protein